VTDEAIKAAADRLNRAASSGTPCAPVRDLIGPDDVVAAYQVQALCNERRALRSTLIGRKIGATSEPVQVQLGVGQPEFGAIFADMRFDDGDVIPYGRLLQPRVEAEVAFVLKDDLIEGPLDVAQCRAAVAFAVPALEIVDSRITDWDVSFADTVADNASSGVFVLGTDRKTLDEFEPAEVLMGLRVDGVLVASGDGTQCLGDPLNALAWLARSAREFGDPLLEGQLILSGALGKLSAVDPGATLEAVIKPLGRVSATVGPRTAAAN
jgi:2-keto-4-pentenoate hydratase